MPSLLQFLNKSINITVLLVCVMCCVGAIYYQRLCCVYNHHDHGVGGLPNGDPVS